MQSGFQYYIRYFIFSVLFIIATVLAFQAGRQGIKHATTVQSSHTLFRSFPLLTDSHLRDQGIKAHDQSAQPLPTAEDKKKNDASKEDKKSESSEIKKNLPKNQSDIKTEPLSLAHPVNSDDTSESESWSVVRMGENLLKDRNKGPITRKKGMPSFSSIYVPVYTSEQLSEGALYGFSQAFQQDSLQGKLFVLEKQTGSSDGGARYEVHVYEQNGVQFKGAFETIETVQFPFQGIPSFQKVEDSQFEHTSRFLVFTGSKGEIEEILSQESNVYALFETAYRPELDPQTFLGSDSNFQVDLYKLFPGIFVAQPLR